MGYAAARRRPFALSAVVLLVVLATVPGTVAAQELPTLQRIRSESQTVLDAIAEGIRWSPSFRRLVDLIYASDGIVYVEEGECGHGVTSCLLMAITAAGPFRLLHVRVNPRRTPGCRLTSTIGHELHHATEVLANPTIRSGQRAYALFDRIGPTTSGRFETQAAIDSGMSIDKEACGRRRSPIGPSTTVARGAPQTGLANLDASAQADGAR